MLYTFESRATGKLLMLEEPARTLLRIIGKDDGPRGIVLVAQIPAAIAALDAAVQRDEQRQPAPEPTNAAAPDTANEREKPISLRQRCAPFIATLRRCQQAGVALTWST